GSRSWRRWPHCASRSSAARSSRLVTSRAESGAGACTSVRAPAPQIESPRMAATPVLGLPGITKQFPGVLANDHIDLDLRRGEVHALLGENGAGKSTLMNIVYGLYSADEGEILVNGKPVEFDSPHDAIANGIGMVHQHFMLIPVMTVAENIVLANEPRHAGVLLDAAAAERRVRDLASTFKFAVDPHARIQDITVGQQQRVEI